MARIFLLSVAAVLLTACGGSSAPARHGPSLYAMLHPQIVPNTKGTYPDSYYVPAVIRVRAGQTLKFTNHDTDPHDVTSSDGWFASGPIADGGTYRLRLTRPGTYPYFCTLHPEMQGEIIVSAQ